MNLWAKRAGLLLSAAVLIFLISCEDDSYLLGFKGKTKFKGRYQELVFDGEKSSVVLLDSVFTDQYAISASPVNAFAYRYLIGYYNDVDFGTVKADLYASFLPNDAPSLPTKFGAGLTGRALDSVTVQLYFDFYAYGPEMDLREEVNVYELSDTLSFYKRYINTSTAGNEGKLLGKLTLKKFSKRKLTPANLTRIKLEEQLDRSSTQRDTFLLQGRLNLDEGDEVNPSFALRLFGYLNTAGDSALIGERIQDFRITFPGLVFEPVQSGRILGYTPLNALSRLTIHFHASTSDSLSTSLYFSPFPYIGANSFNNISTNRSGALSGISVPGESYYPYSDPASSERFVQDGSAVITELDLSDYYNFIDTLENIIINSAEISMEVKDYPPGVTPIPVLYSVLMKEEGNKIVPLNIDIDADSVKMSQFRGSVYSDLTNFAISTELSAVNPLSLSYDKNTKKYSGYATMFFQKLFDNKEKPEYNIEHIGFYPATAPILKILTTGSTTGYPLLTSGIGNSVNRAVLKTSGIKLKLYYTVPNKPNLE